MTAQQPSSSGALLARKGTASPLGLRRPRIVAEDAEQPEAESPAAGEAAQDVKAKPVQLELVSGLEPAAGGASNEPPPAASLFPFSLRRALREQDDTWELVSPDLLARMAAVGRQSPDSSESPGAEAGAEEGPAPLDRAESAASAPPIDLAAPETPETLESETPEAPASLESLEIAATPRALESAPETVSEPVAVPATVKAPMALPPVGPLARGADPVARITPHVTGKPAAKPAAKAPNAAATPVADPSWRIGVEKLPGADSGGARRMVAMVAAAAVAIAAIAWWSYSAQDGAPGDAPAVSETASNTAPQTPQEKDLAAADAISSSAPATAGAGTQDAAPQAPAPEAIAPAPIPQDAAAPTTQNAAIPAGAPTAQPSAPAQAIAPSVDLVRIEPNGDAVIAGRAAPESELILLDNGKPIGTVKADIFGEWVFVPEQPLNDGSHEFGLVVKSVEGKVSVPAEAPKHSTPPAQLQPAPDDAAQPAPEPKGGAALSTGQGGDPAGAVPVPPRKPDAVPGATNSNVPIPVRKPVLRQSQVPAPAPAAGSTATGAASSDFVVQLASVKTHAGARREWEKLQSRFPEYLGGMNLNLDEAKLSQRGTVVRVRTGPFSDLNEAQGFCARMRAVNQDCLVLRTTGEKLSMVAR